MADQQDDQQTGASEKDMAVMEPPAQQQASRKKQPAKTPPKQAPPYKVLLHNDDVNDFPYVIRTICRLTTLSAEEAWTRTLEAHESGLSLLLVTHQERAELYQEQFTSAGLTVTIEPDEVS